MVETSTFTEWKSTTPLLLACYNGFLDIATFLIEQCNVDVDEVGTVTIDKETIEDAPPLWFAAYSGHLNLVKLLVRCGASINKTTKSNSSPLRAACYEGHFDIVVFLIQHGADIEIANIMGHTCLMIACYKNHPEIVKYLLDKGADINRTYDDGSTALSDAAISGNLDIIKLLIKHGAKPSNSLKFCHLLTAASKANENVVEFLIEEFNCTKEEKVDALKLLGAAFMDEKLDMSMALKYWRQAMQLQYENLACPLKKPIVDSCLGAFLNETEVHTLSELEKLKSDPYKMKIQALVMRERILGLDHIDTLFYTTLRAARQLDDEKDYHTYIKLYVFVLSCQQKLQKPFSQETCNTLSVISELCCLILNDSSQAETFHCFFSYILQAFEIALKEIEIAIELSQNQDQDLSSGTQFFHTVIYAIHLVCFMHKMQPYLNETQKLKLEKTVSQLIHINPRFKNGSLIHFLTCFKRPDFVTHSIVPFPSPEIIDLFVKIGGF